MYQLEQARSLSEPAVQVGAQVYPMPRRPSRGGLPQGQAVTVSPEAGKGAVSRYFREKYTRLKDIPAATPSKAQYKAVILSIPPQRTALLVAIATTS